MSGDLQIDGSQSGCGDLVRIHVSFGKVFARSAMGAVQASKAEPGLDGGFIAGNALAVAGRDFVIYRNVMQVLAALRASQMAVSMTEILFRGLARTPEVMKNEMILQITAGAYRTFITNQHATRPALRA